MNLQADLLPAALRETSIRLPDEGIDCAHPLRRILTLTSLFPSSARPRHGIFVETRLRKLLRHAALDARVIAPVPWFPSSARLFGEYAALAATPRHDVRDGLPVSYPRYLMLPKIGMAMQPDAMARAAFADLNLLLGTGWYPDLIDAHYFYPDGVAASLLADRLRLPLVITARGTDVNVIGQMPGPARRMRSAASRAAAIIAVSPRLRDALIALGVGEGKITVLRNGVDLELLQPDDRAACRRQFGLSDGLVVACVGNLVPEKDQALAIESLAHLPGCRLLVAGDGPLRKDLGSLSRRLGVEARVVFVPPRPQHELRKVYSSADVLLLTSKREGWPNVVLESLACGTPVVAVDVGAVREMLTSPTAGRVVTTRDPRDLAAAIRDLVKQDASRQEIRLHAERFDWDAVSRGQLDVFREVLARHRAARKDPEGE